MAGGFLNGALWGGVVSVGVGAVASVIAPLPQDPATNTAPPQTVETPLPVATPADVAPLSNTASRAQDDAIATATDAVTPDAPDVDTLAALDTAPAVAPDMPQTGIPEGLEAPAAGDASGTLVLNAEDPVFPNPQALAPMIPQDPDTVRVDTAPASPPKNVPETPEIVQDAGTTLSGTTNDAPAPADASEPQEAVETTNEAEPSESVQIGEAPQPDTLTADAPSQDLPKEETPTDEEIPAQAAQGDSTQQQATLEALTPPTITLPEQGAPETNDTGQGEATRNSEVAMVVPTVRPQLGTPAVSLTDRDSAVRIRRPDPEDATTGASEPGVTVINEDRSARGGDPRPIVQFAQRFSNPDDKPLMGIVLIDDGTSPTTGASGIAALRSFPYSLNMAVDSSLPDAAERMTLYREAGFEVMAMVDMPGGAQASDVETTLGVTLSQLDLVVGVLEGPGEGLQGSREVSDQVAAILAQTGHGLVTQDKGLNTVPKLARKEGVPADPVFRDFDSKGQTATVIRRFLDQAAFKAGQEGAVIMLGRLRPETISALLLWGLQDRAGQVAIAPISAVLRREEG